MTNFHLKIVQPGGLFFEGDVKSLNIRTTDGYIGVLGNHVPIITSLEISPLKFIESNSKSNECVISGGFMYLDKNNVTIVTDDIQHIKDINVNKARELKIMAERKLKDRQESENYVANKALLKKATTLLQAKSKGINN